MPKARSSNDAFLAFWLAAFSLVVLTFAGTTASIGSSLAPPLATANASCRSSDTHGAATASTSLLQMRARRASVSLGSNLQAGSRSAAAAATATAVTHRQGVRRARHAVFVADLRHAVTELGRSQNVSNKELDKLIARFIDHHAADEDKCPARLMEAKHQLNDLHKAIHDLAEQINTTEADLHIIAGDLEDVKDKIKDIENDKAKDKGKVKDEKEDEKKMLATLRAEMEEMRQIAQPSVAMSIPNGTIDTGGGPMALIQLQPARGGQNVEEVQNLVLQTKDTASAMMTCFLQLRQQRDEAQQQLLLVQGSPLALEAVEAVSAPAVNEWVGFRAAGAVPPAAAMPAVTPVLAALQNRTPTVAADVPAATAIAVMPEMATLQDRKHSAGAVPPGAALSDVMPVLAAPLNRPPTPAVVPPAAASPAVMPVLAALQDRKRSGAAVHPATEIPAMMPVLAALQNRKHSVAAAHPTASVPAVKPVLAALQVVSGIRNCSVNTTVDVKVGDTSKKVTFGRKVPTGTPGYYHCSKVEPAFGGVLMLHCKDGELTADARGCFRYADEKRCLQQKQQLEDTYVQAYVELARLIKEYEDLISPDDDGDVNGEIQSVKEEPKRELEDKLAKEQEEKLRQLEELRPRLEDMIRAESKLREHIKKLSEECQQLPDTASGLQKVRDAIRALEACPGLGRATFHIPSWAGEWVQITLDKNKMDKANDAVALQACVDKYGKAKGIRVAEVSEILAVSVEGMPLNNTAPVALIGACPHCEGLDDTATGQKNREGHSRICWDPGVKLGRASRRQDCSLGPKAVMCVYDRGDIRKTKWRFTTPLPTTSTTTTAASIPPALVVFDPEAD